MSSSPQLPGIFHALQPVMDRYGYLALGLVFLEDFGVPAPGETVLVAAAVYAGAGRLNIVAVAVIGFLAAVLGDNVGYLIGRAGGRRLVLRLGRYVWLSEERLDKAEAWFDRHGGKVIVAARFIEGLRQANGIVAGVIRMHWARFVVFNAIGAALWVGVWCTVGYESGSHLDTVYSAVSRVFILVVAVVVIAVVAHLLWRRRRRARAAGQERGMSTNRE